MPGEAGHSDSARVSPLDRRSRPISPVVRIAAEEVSRRAMQHAERLYFDPAEAANVLEEAAAAVSRALISKKTDTHSIQNLESYLFRAFLRRLSRTRKRQLLLAEKAQLENFHSRTSQDPRAALEMKIFIDEFIMHCDPAMQDVLCRRMAGYSWNEIARLYGISRHAAESKFSQAIQRVKKKLRLK
jgi:DNA-directed RNA polymerase specialized sigma24 family protein